MRSWLRKLEREARGEVESFELLDGSRYWYDPLGVTKEPFQHSLDCGRTSSPEDWPKPPEVYLKMCEAKDPEAVLERFVPSDKEAWFIDFPYEVDALLIERRLESIPHEPVPDLSE